jgi:XTP/dITP diphosphohydrolase
MEIVIASHNLHKIREFREMFKAFKGLAHLDILSLLNFPKYELPEETGTTFKENALLKARDAAAHTKKWVLADDSGLVVPKLQGSPGVYSARYAGEQATDADNRQKLLSAMQGMTGLERCAYFECCLVLCGPNGTEKCVTGICEGHLLTEERGRHGFGYDPLFVKNDYEKTFAELDDSVKNRISHRYKAFEKLVNALEALK